MNNLLYVFIGYITSSIAKIQNLILYRLRISPAEASNIYFNFKNIEHKKHFFHSTFQKNNYTIPLTESSFRIINKVPFIISFSEHELHTGFDAKETLCDISTIFFFRKKLHLIVNELSKVNNTKIKKHEIVSKVFMRFWDKYEQIHELKQEDVVFTILPQKTKESIDYIVGEFVNGKRKKTGIILHGPAGNGKSSIVKQIALEYGFNIYLPIFYGDMNNTTIIKMFLDIPKEGKKIILLEDFDGTFNKRRPIRKDANYTFDALLNCFDGVYCNLDNTLLILTTNYLEKIDVALKSRPSRFDLIIEIEKPTYAERLSILHNFNLNGLSEPIAKLTEGQSAAIVCEIAKRNLSEEPDVLKLQVEAIIESFKEEEIAKEIETKELLLKQESKLQTKYLET